MVLFKYPLEICIFFTLLEGRQDTDVYQTYFVALWGKRSGIPKDARKDELCIYVCISHDMFWER